jgi:hypothetical protein
LLGVADPLTDFLSEGVPKRASASNLLDGVVGEVDTTGDLDTRHRGGDSAAQDDVGGFRVGADVVFGIRLIKLAAHDREVLHRRCELCAGFDGAGDVGKRADGDDVDRPRMCGDMLGQEGGSVVPVDHFAVEVIVDAAFMSGPPNGAAGESLLGASVYWDGSGMPGEPDEAFRDASAEHRVTVDRGDTNQVDILGAEQDR